MVSKQLNVSYSNSSFSQSVKAIRLFFVHSFNWNQTTKRWNSIFRVHLFFRLASYVDGMFIDCLWPFKFHSEIFPKRSHKICSHFAIIETAKVGKSSFYRFPKKKNSWYQEIHRQIINLMASLRCHWNSDVKIKHKS